MALYIDLPQCPICQEPFLAGSHLVAPSNCGHVYCSECASEHFKTSRECAICRAPIKHIELVKLYVDRGRHDVLAISQASRIREDQEEEQIPLASHGFGLVRGGLRIVKELDDLSNVDLSSWGAPTEENYRGATFLRAGDYLDAIGDLMKEDEQMKSIIKQIGNAFARLHRVYLSIVHLVQDNADQKRLVEREISLRKEAAKQHETDTHKLQREYARERRNIELREEDLKQKMRNLNDTLETAQRRILTLEGEQELIDGELRKHKRDAVAYRKKYHGLKQENDMLQKLVPRRSAQVGSDSSLVIEGDDGDDEFPLPSSAPPTTQDTVSSAPSQVRPENPPPSELVEGHLLVPSNIINCAPDPYFRNKQEHAKAGKNRPLIAQRSDSGPSRKDSTLSRDNPRAPFSRTSSRNRIPIMPVPSRRGDDLVKSPKKRQKFVFEEVL